ncbi:MULTISPECIES: Na/Pi symporter [Pseudovibrio]|uniref:Na/Pi symporter n=1 Tax=Stappiaceae TaxID=2821832 RepID=UPI002365A554|nr:MULTISPECIES: Na/Pi symporter [Pseudovibrio]MDD7911383.1 Na/Pi symporter [Pseudovibrio exalbescens]MDX5592930.1 Na/Pi symporter [Pseudovibrio sp. SPO723]
MSKLDSFKDDDSNAALGISLLNWVSVLFLAYFLLCAVGLLEAGFRTLYADHAEHLIQAATNPITGVCVGILATALVQSSSVTTSILVGFVAGGLPIEVAIPIVMGANFGTTLTNTIVALGFAANREELKRAFAAASVHDCFNLLCIAFFLPLELMFGIFEKMIHGILSILPNASFVHHDLTETFNFISAATAPFVQEVANGVSTLPYPGAGASLIAIGLCLVVFCIHFMKSLLRALLVGSSKRIAETALNHGPVAGVASGCAATMLTQSSSTTTSLVVPLVGSGALTTRQVYPFTLGANIGTCITAILAAFAVTGARNEAFELAFIHLLYNVLGVSIVLAVPKLRYLPAALAERLSTATQGKRVWIITYLALAFFVVPALGILALG